MTDAATHQNSSRREQTEVRLDAIGHSARVALLKLRGLYRILLLWNHEERALANERRHPHGAADRNVLIVNAQVAEPHFAHHARLNETRERLRLRMKEQRTGTDIWERVYPVAERIEMNRDQRVRVRSARDDAAQMEIDRTE